MSSVWKMQILDAKEDWVAGTRYVDVQQGWLDVVPTPLEGCNLPPFRYEDKKDAEAMLDKLFPEIPPDFKRVVRE